MLFRGGLNTKDPNLMVRMAVRAFLALAWGVAFRLGISMVLVPPAGLSRMKDHSLTTSSSAYLDFLLMARSTLARTSTGDLRRSPNAKRPYMSASRSHTDRKSTRLNSSHLGI